MRRTMLSAVAMLAVAMAGCDVRDDPALASLGPAPGNTVTFNITPNTVSLTTGQSAQLTLNTTRALGPYNWRSSQAAVASVDDFGLVTAVGTGTATITVSSAVDPTAVASATVTVRSASQTPP